MKGLPSAIVLLSSYLFQSALAYNDENYVTCGSAVKLTHMESGGTHYLSSAQHKINSGSNQQLVTASPDRSGSESLWLVTSAHGGPPCTAGSTIPYGSKFRLTHLDTGKNLHSHLYRSPLSNNQEVTGFGDNGGGDQGDNFTVNPAKKSSSNHWTRDDIVIIKHVDTGKNLGATKNAMFSRNNCGNRCPVMQHLEVFASSGSYSQSHWRADLGVYLSS